MPKEKDSNQIIRRSFCDERTRRIEETIKSMKNEILLGIKQAVDEQHSMSWKAKATIAAALIMAASSIIVALIYSL